MPLARSTRLGRGSSAPTPMTRIPRSTLDQTPSLCRPPPEKLRCRRLLRRSFREASNLGEPSKDLLLAPSLLELQPVWLVSLLSRSPPCPPHPPRRLQPEDPEGNDWDLPSQGAIRTAPALPLSSSPAKSSNSCSSSSTGAAAAAADAAAPMLRGMGWRGATARPLGPRQRPRPAVGCRLPLPPSPLPSSELPAAQGRTRSAAKAAKTTTRTTLMTSARAPRTTRKVTTRRRTTRRRRSPRSMMNWTRRSATAIAKKMPKGSCSPWGLWDPGPPAYRC
mmetsp:Transcript_19452/g.29115  ORF Transcript_19452/g.29115 Transcript_19452/m.29115 type:complete len:278 (+) Transcript_19452:21-854(+)